MMKNVKIVVFVPSEKADDMRQALGEAGAGSLGDYTYCSYSFVGKGRFTPQTGARPAVGEVGRPEVTTEERIEVICERSKAKRVIEALRLAHPYEEPAFDIIPLLDESEL